MLFIKVMRRAFNLIELIFTIVIMAGIFSVIPKILFATGKSDAFSIKQDALLQTISLTNIASLLPWDQNNSNNTDILQTTSTHFKCDVSNRYRIGTYMSANARMCTQEINASHILGAESTENDYLLYNDIDDFNNLDINVTTSSGKLKYRLYNQVSYLTDNIITTSGSSMTIDLNLSTSSSTSTNIKKFKSIVGYVGNRGTERNISSFYYYSTNIGQFTLNSRNW